MVQLTAFIIILQQRKDAIEQTLCKQINIDCRGQNVHNPPDAKGRYGRSNKNDLLHVEHRLSFPF